jgi:hypothetical protein
MAVETEIETDVAGDAPVGLGADIPNAPIIHTPAPQNTIDEIDRLLAEFDAGTSQPTDQPVDQSTDEWKIARDQAFTENLRAHTENLQLDSKRAKLDAYERQLAGERDQKDTIAAVAEIRGELDSRYFDDQFVQSWLLSQAMSNPRLNEIWNSRADNPRAYQAMIGKLSAEFSQKYSRLPDPVATEDHFAVAQAVRGQGGRVLPEPAPDFSRMDERQFQQWKNENMK